MQKYIDALVAHGWHVEAIGHTLWIRVKPRRVVRIRFWEDGSHSAPSSRHTAERAMVADAIQDIG